MGIWSKVLILATWALTLFLGHWPLWTQVAGGALALGAVVYLGYREQKGFSTEFVRGNLLYLLPGHMLLLLGLSLAQAPLGVWGVWATLVVTTLGFDAVANSRWSFKRRKGLGMVLYTVIWAAIFLLIQQLISLGGKLNPVSTTVISISLAIAALAYITMALYRFTKLQPLKE